jgi:hypothetical protein
MRGIRFSALFLLLSALLALPAGGQALSAPDSLESRYADFVTRCAPEKLFLHLDRSYYAIGETLYFDGYLQNATARSILPLSRYLYVELQDAKGENKARVKIKRNENGDFPGQLEIPDNLTSGIYTLRAYTLWQLNGAAEDLFHTPVKILGYPEPPQKPARQRRKAAEDSLDVTFYPESGRYFAGSLSRIGFKAQDREGRNVELRAAVVSSSGEQVAEAATLHEGMGLFIFIPQPGERYHFVVEGGGSYPLPEAAAEGASISLVAIPHFLRVTLQNHASGPVSLYVRDASNLRHLYTAASGTAEITLKIASENFDPGINHFLLLDAAGRICAERLFYVYDDEAREAICTFTPENKKHHARELIRSELTLHDGAGPVDGVFSVSVVRGSFQGYRQPEEIVSYMRLSSELRGRIDHPAYYFDPGVPLEKRRARLDLLMMIQGWRYYDLETIFANPSYAPHIHYAKEYWQSISGKVSRAFSERMPRKYYFTVFSPKLKAQRVEEIGEGKRFLIDSLDFEKNTGFFIEIDRIQTGLEYIPTWDGDPLASKHAYKTPKWLFERPEVKERETIPLALDGPLVDTLEAAVVTASASNPFGTFFNGDRFNRDLDQYSQMTLIDYVLQKEGRFTYDTETMFNTSTGHLSSLGGSDDENAKIQHYEVKLIVDDVVEEWWMFDHLRLEDIEQMEISNNADPFYKADGGYVAIKLKSGRTIGSTRETKPSRLYFVPLGYQRPHAFYAPRYDKGDTSDEFDHRNTVWWQASATTQGGRAQIEFCNTDQQDFPYYVQINGLARDGRPFSRYCVIEN